MSSRSARQLPSLLQSFRLPASATATDLRQAYLREAKRLHPDKRVAGERALAEKEFVELQERFDEGLHLISKKGTDRSPNFRPPWGTGLSKRKGGSAYAPPESRGGRQPGTAYYGSRSPLPSQGLPAQHVYLAACVVAAMASFFMWRRDDYTSAKHAMSKAAASSAVDAFEPLPLQRPPPNPSKQAAPKQAWENISSASKGPHAVPITALPVPSDEDLASAQALCKRSQWSDDQVAQIKWRAISPSISARSHTGSPSISERSHTGSKYLCERSLTQDGRSEDQVARDLAKYFDSQSHRAKAQRTRSSRVSPQVRDGVPVTAAHVASEDGRVWWLEQCGASRCRRGLEEADRRGDTPLHRCAKTGQAPTCHALLRVGADPSMENQSRLLPEDLASHEGHAKLAETLRGLRMSHARRGCEPGCSVVHGNGEICRLCGDRYGQHLRHRCRDGDRGSFPVKVPTLRTGRNKTDLLVDPTTLLTRRYEAGSEPEEEVSQQYLHAAFQGSLLLRLHAAHSQLEPPLAAWETVLRHPDGLGLLAAPPNGVPYDGPRHTEFLRRAVNFAAGAVVFEQTQLERQGVAQNPPDFSGPLDHSHAVHYTAAPRRAGSEVDIGVSIRRASEALARFGLALEPAGAEVTGGGWVDCIGMLVFEAESSGSEDAPAHWTAVRASGSEFWRLDPVRGSFRMTSQEFAELRCRYNGWRVVGGSSANTFT